MKTKGCIQPPHSECEMYQQGVLGLHLPAALANDDCDRFCLIGAQTGRRGQGAITLFMRTAMAGPVRRTVNLLAEKILCEPLGLVLSR